MSYFGVNRRPGVTQQPLFSKVKLYGDASIAPMRQDPFGNTRVNQKWLQFQNPIALEAREPRIKPPHAIATRELETKFQQKLSLAAPEERTAIYNQKHQGLEQALESETNEVYRQKFEDFMRGIAPDAEYQCLGWNTDTFRQGQFGAKNEPLSMHPTVISYFDASVDASIDYQKDLAKLRNKAQSTGMHSMSIDECWKLYKFYVLGIYDAAPALNPLSFSAAPPPPPPSSSSNPANPSPSSNPPPSNPPPPGSYFVPPPSSTPLPSTTTTSVPPPPPSSTTSTPPPPPSTSASEPVQPMRSKKTRDTIQDTMKGITDRKIDQKETKQQQKQQQQKEEKQRQNREKAAKKLDEAEKKHIEAIEHHRNGNQKQKEHEMEVDAAQANLKRKLEENNKKDQAKTKTKVPTYAQKKVVQQSTTATELNRKKKAEKTVLPVPAESSPQTPSTNAESRAPPPDSERPRNVSSPPDEDMKDEMEFERLIDPNVSEEEAKKRIKHRQSEAEKRVTMSTEEREAMDRERTEKIRQDQEREREQRRLEQEAEQQLKRDKEERKRQQKQKIIQEAKKIEEEIERLGTLKEMSKRLGATLGVIRLSDSSAAGRLQKHLTELESEHQRLEADYTRIRHQNIHTKHGELHDHVTNLREALHELHKKMDEFHSLLQDEQEQAIKTAEARKVNFCNSIFF